MPLFLNQRMREFLARLRSNIGFVNFVLITLAVCLANLFYLAQVHEEGLRLARAEQEEALQVFWSLLLDKGEHFSLRDGQLLVDDTLLSGNTEIPDRIAATFPVTASLFVGKVRVATSALDVQGGRAVGTEMDPEVSQALYTWDQPYRGAATVLGRKHFTGYDPLRNAEGQVIGAVAVGIDQEAFFASFDTLRRGIFLSSALIESILIFLSFLYFRDRRQHESQRQASASRYRALFDVAAEGIFLLGENFTIIDCNPAAVKMFGGSREDLLGATPFDVSPAHQPSGRISLEVGEGLITAVRRGESRFLFWQHRRFDGGLFDTELSLQRLDDPSGILVQATIRDVTEKRRDQRLVEESERRYRALFEMNGVATVLCTEDFGIVLANREFCTLTRHTQKQMAAGLYLTQFFDESCRQRLRRILPELRRDAQTPAAMFDCDLQLDNGDNRHVTVYLADIPGSQRFLATLHDITVLKHLGLSLQAQLKFLQTLIDTIPNPVFYKDRAGRYLGCNRTFETEIGIKRDEIVGKSVYDLAPLDLARVYAVKDEELFANPGVQTYESQVQSPRGSLHDVMYYKATYTDDDGQVAGLVGVMLDITEQKRVEATLRDSEERFHQLFAQHHDAVLLMRADGRAILDANVSAQRLFGYDWEGFLSLLPPMLFETGQFDQLIAAVDGEAGSEGFRIDNIPGVRADGGVFPASLWGKLVSLRNQRVIFCSVRDLTEKIQLEEVMRASQAKLIHVNKMTSLGLLTSSVGHEINNPNSYIAVNATLLTDIWRDALPVLRQYAGEQGDFSLGGLPFSEMESMVPRLCTGISEGSRRISTIVNDLKSFVRQEKWGTREVLDINKVVQDAVNILWHHIHKQTDHFALELADGLPPVRGSAQQMEQVVINLTMNALQALPDKSRAVRLRTLVEGAEVQIVIEDEGDGMSEAVREKLAEPFFTTRMDKGGTGLGLYITTSILTDHGARLDFTSAPGAGTTATVFLPAAEMTVTA